MLKRLVILTFVMGCITGCDSQSPNANYVHNIPIALCANIDRPAWELDVWDVKPDETGSEIYGAAFGYKCKVKANDTPLKGIKVACYVTGEKDSTGGDYNIWDKQAPNGEKYGYVYPGPLGSWDYDEGVAAVRTDEDGHCFFFIGLGNPKTGYGSSNPGYEWPSGCSTMVSNQVNVKFVIPKFSGNIEQECYMYFIRAQCQDFWSPVGGVIGNSFSSLSEPPEGLMGIEELRLMTTSVEPIELLADKSHKRQKPFDNLRNKSRGKQRLPNDLIYNDLTLNIQSFETLGGEEWKYYGGTWYQYRFDDYWYWVMPDVLIPLWLADPCDPNDATDLVSQAEPYSFYCRIGFDGKRVLKSFTHTVILVSKNNDGIEVAWSPIRMQKYRWLYYWWYISLMSDWVIPMENPVEQGIYIDSWGAPCVAIYVPDGGHLEIRVDEFYGDFNFDGCIDFEDYAMLANQLHKNIWDDEDVDLMYDATQDGQISDDDLAIFTENWLNERE